MNDHRYYSCFFLGLGAGVAAGLLLAPGPGVRTRKILIDTAKDGQDFLKRQSSEVREQMAETLSKGKKAVARAAGGIEEVLETGRQALRS